VEKAVRSLERSPIPCTAEPGGSGPLADRGRKDPSPQVQARGSPAMKESLNPLYRTSRWDYALAAAFLISSFAAFVPLHGKGGAPGEKAMIYQQGALIRQIPSREGQSCRWRDGNRGFGGGSPRAAVRLSEADVRALRSYFKAVPDHRVRAQSGAGGNRLPVR